MTRRTRLGTTREEISDCFDWRKAQEQATDKFYSNIPFHCWPVPLKQQTTYDPHQALVQNGDRGR
ncbi:protein of unknown function [Paraburkholderia dioscoreae]|uniref:Uncharacterized protein n=1 Tax=Paraburkholderia dioscoreae TaxID=2604047 RepID=A0A5Q4Z2F1_9BURK|nr:protein of unknown function [Paraburkholderia dioscoreae]